MCRSALSDCGRNVSGASATMQTGLCQCSCAIRSLATCPEGTPAAAGDCVESPGSPGPICTCVPQIPRGCKLSLCRLEADQSLIPSFSRPSLFPKQSACVRSFGHRRGTCCTECRGFALQRPPPAARRSAAACSRPADRAAASLPQTVRED